MAEKANRRRAPARSPEARENQLISLAIDLAEKQIENGQASSQVITHFLKLGTSNSQLEKKKLEEEIKLLEAKTKNLATQENMEKLLKAATTAMRSYQGADDVDDD